MEQGDHEGEHYLIAEVLGHVHGINPEVTVQADLVRCAGCIESPPAIGVAVGWTDEDGDRCFGSALLDPGAALSLATTILAAVGVALGNDQKQQNRVVAEILRGVDMDADLAALLDAES